MLSQLSLCGTSWDWHSNGLGNSSSVVWVDLVKQSNHFLLSGFVFDGTECSGQVLDQVFSVCFRKHIGPKSSWLVKIVVDVLVGVSSGLSVEFLGGMSKGWVLSETSFLGGWFIVNDTTLVIVVDEVVSLVVE